MAQIILLDPHPPSASEILTHIVRQMAIVLGAVILLDVITSTITATNELNTLMNTYIWPYIRYLLWAGGITVTPLVNSQITAMGSLLLILLLYPVMLIKHYVRVALYEGREQMKSAQTYDRWFVSALAFGILLALWRTYPLPAFAGIQNDVFLLLRLTAVLGGGMVVLAFLRIGFALRREWTKLHPAPPKAAKPQKPELKVIETPKAKPTERALLVALVAELIQFCGQNNRAPTAPELADKLGPLLRAAQLTGSNPISPGELAKLCETVMDLFGHKKIGSLRDVKTAITLFGKPKPGAMDEIVNELDQRLNK